MRIYVAIFDWSSPYLYATPDVSRGRGFRTSQGIAAGSSREDALRAYGNPTAYNIPFHG